MCRSKGNERRANWNLLEVFRPWVLSCWSCLWNVCSYIGSLSLIYLCENITSVIQCHCYTFIHKAISYHIKNNITVTTSHLAKYAPKEIDNQIILSFWRKKWNVATNSTEIILISLFYLYNLFFFWKLLLTWFLFLPRLFQLTLMKLLNKLETIPLFIHANKAWFDFSLQRE